MPGDNICVVYVMHQVRINLVSTIYDVDLKGTTTRAYQGSLLSTGLDTTKYSEYPDQITHRCAW